MLSSVFAGFSTGASLIVAIGAQNAFVLRQGMRGEHVLWVCLICAGSDALLIGLGLFGVGALLNTFVLLNAAMRIAGALFVASYGLRSMRNAYHGGQALLPSPDSPTVPLYRVLATCLALTWLNPHVYLDTLVLIGGIGTQDPSPGWFGVGAMAASFGFFFTLGLGARALAPLFARPVVWRVLDALLAVVMWCIAAVLLKGLLPA